MGTRCEIGSPLFTANKEQVMAKFKCLVNVTLRRGTLQCGQVYDSEKYGIAQGDLKKWEERGMIETGPKLKADPAIVGEPKPSAPEPLNEVEAAARAAEANEAAQAKHDAEAAEAHERSEKAAREARGGSEGGEGGEGGEGQEDS